MRPAFLDLLAPRCPRCAQTSGWRVDSESAPGPVVWHGRLGPRGSPPAGPPFR